MLAGPLVLSEALPTSPLLLALRLIAFGGAAVGATLLARSRAGQDSPLAELSASAPERDTARISRASVVAP
jgi:hypothetical protein